MSCGGHADKSPNANSLLISDVIQNTGTTWHAAAYVFHGLVSDAKEECAGPDGRKTRHPAVQQAAEARARVLLPLALDNPDYLPDGYTESRSRIAECQPKTESVADLAARVDKLAADPTVSPEELAAARADYYAALDSALDNEITHNVPDGTHGAVVDQEGMLRLTATTATSPGHAGTEPETVALRNLTAALRTQDDPQITLTDDEQAQIAVTAKASLTQIRDHISAIETDLVARVDAHNLRGVHDPQTGVAAYPVGGARYTGWQHEKARHAVATRIAAQEGIDESEAKGILDDYTSYASIDYYRSAALRELGLKPRWYATVVPEPRRFDLKFPDWDNEPVSGTVSEQAWTNRSDLEALPAQIEAIRDRISAMPLDNAFRELTSLRHSQRSLARAVAAIESDTARHLSKAGVDTVDVNGTVWTPHRSKSSVRWATSDVDRVIIHRLASEQGRDPKTVGKVIDRFRGIAHVKGFKVRALSGAGIDPDDYKHTAPGSWRLTPAKADPADPAAA
jgi:hypothetical protein